MKFPIGYQHLVFFVYFVVSRLFWVCFFFKVYYLYSKWVINMIMYSCNIAISLLSQHQSIIYTCIMQSKWCKCTYRFDLLGALQIDFKLHPMKNCVLLEIFLLWVYTLDVIFVSNLFAPFPIFCFLKKQKTKKQISSDTSIDSQKTPKQRYKETNKHNTVTLQHHVTCKQIPTLL